MFSFHIFSQGSASPVFWASLIIMGFLLFVRKQKKKTAVEPHPGEVNVSCVKDCIACKENVTHNYSLIQVHRLKLKKSNKYIIEICSYYFSHGFSISYTNSKTEEFMHGRQCMAEETASFLGFDLL